MFRHCFGDFVDFFIPCQGWIQPYTQVHKMYLNLCTLSINELFIQTLLMRPDVSGNFVGEMYFWEGDYKKDAKM